MPGTKPDFIVKRRALVGNQHASNQARRPCRRGRGRVASWLITTRARAGHVVDTSASDRCFRVVVVQVGRLHELHHVEVAGHTSEKLHVADDDWTGDQGDEEDEQDEVEYGVSYDSAPAEFGLLQGVNGRSNLAAVCLLA